MIEASRRDFLSMAAASISPFRIYSADLREPDAVVPLWPDRRMPGAPVEAMREGVIDQIDTAGLRYRVAEKVMRPTLSCFRPAQPNGAAVLIIPGGGYTRVGIDREGYESARWLNAQGIAAFVLRYRLPGDRWRGGANVAFQDAQRAIRLIREGAAGWPVDPARVAVLGGSAGGHLAGCLATRVYDQSYDPIDAADRQLTRPDAAILLYPVISMQDGMRSASRRALLGDAPGQGEIDRWSLERNVPTTAPPLLLIHAAADRTVPYQHSMAMFDAVRASGGSVDLHLFDQGAHGLGLRYDPALPMADWPNLALRWLRPKL